jgi:copper resistance protein D
MADALSLVLRAMSFILLFQAAGLAIFVALFGDRIPNLQDRIRRRGQVVALAAIAFVAGHYALEAARMAGDLSGIWDITLQQMVWNSSNRAAFIGRLMGLLLIALGLRGPRGRSTVLAVLGSMLVAGAFTLTGHTSVSTHRLILAALLMVHLLVVAFWFGALWPLYLASSRETPALAADLIERFSGMATWLVPAILLAGAVMAIVLLPNVAALSQPYGELLIAKVVGFALLMGLAAANKWRFGPAIAHGTIQSGRRFRLSLATEFVLISVVLAITAVMTTLYSPEA